MTKMQMFINTLNDYELGLVKEWTEANKEELAKKTEDEAVDKFIASLCWHYKNEAEYASGKEAAELEKRKAHINKEWKRLGIA